jgi:hypothetical protein
VTRSRADSNGRGRRHRAERAGGQEPSLPRNTEEEEEEEDEEERDESVSAIIFTPSFLPFLMFLNCFSEVYCWTPNYPVAALVVDFLETDNEHFVLLLSSFKFGS